MAQSTLLYLAGEFFRGLESCSLPTRQIHPPRVPLALGLLHGDAPVPTHHGHSVSTGDTISNHTDTTGRRGRAPAFLGILTLPVTYLLVCFPHWAVHPAGQIHPHILNTLFLLWMLNRV